MAESKNTGSYTGSDTIGSSMGQGGSSMRDEEDNNVKTTRMEEEDESLLDESEGEQDDRAASKEKSNKSSSSVSALVNTFLKVRVGSNSVFENGGHNTSTINTQNSSVMAPESQKQEGGGLPRECSMVRAARRNWLAATSLSGIGPLARKPCQSVLWIQYWQSGGAGRW